MNKVTTFIIVALIAGIAYWSYTSSPKSVVVEEVSLDSVESASDIKAIDDISLDGDIDASMQEIDKDLSNL
jgi:cell division septal protein FtsQ